MAPHQAQSFGALLRRLREGAGLTQKQLADRAGLTAKGIGALERGDRRHPQPHTAKALVTALELRDQERAELLAAIPKRPPPSVPAQVSIDNAEPRLGARSSHTNPLLLTKLHRPQVTVSMVERSRLHVTFRTGVTRSLTLVAAPAGYGKTTLVAQQLSALPQPSAWLSLDAGDNDPATFARYLVAAVQSVTASVSAPTHSLVQAGTSRLETVLLSLSNDLAALPHDLVVALDDYHLLTNPAIHTAMAFLLDHLPPLLHVVIVTREDPPFPLAKLRARRQLVEIRANDLRFIQEETAGFLHEQMGLALQPEDVARLGERTEGWIAGLHLAALSLQQHGAASASEFVAAFGGSNRFVIDYLLDEVIAQLPAHTRTFLLSTSILERLCGPLCDAVLDLAPHDTATGSSEGSYSQDILIDLERRHLFLIPLDAERRWYRYHQLFADVLQQRLRAGASDDERAALHARASTWLAAQDLIPEAIHHATRARAWEQAIGLIERHGLPLMLRGHVHTVQNWLHLLPPSLLPAHPFLHVLHGAALLFTNQLPPAEARLQEVEQLVATDAGNEQAGIIRGTALLLRANLARFRGDLPQFLTLAQQALDILPAAALLQRSVARLNLASAYTVTGDVTFATECAFTEALERARLSGDLSAIVRGKVALAGLQQLQGRLREAQATYRGVAELMTHAEVNAALIDSAAYFVGVGDILCERNDLVAAEQCLTEGRRLVCGTVVWSANVFIRGHIASARVLHARGDIDGARRLLEDALRNARERAFADDMVRRLRAAHAQLALLGGEQETAITWATASGIGADDPVAFLRESEYLTLARVYIARGRRDPRGTWLPDAVRLLDRWIISATEGERWGSVIELLILRALTLAAQGNEQAALEALGRALDRAAPEGYVRIFVDEGEAMRVLLHKLKMAGASRCSAHIDTLLAAFAPERLTNIRPDVQQGPPAPPPADTFSVPSMTEALTERERDVLRLLASGSSNQAIADHLVISQPTAKKHVANILGKLQAHNRTEAVARARALHLL